jgi:hypothetical protein
MRVVSEFDGTRETTHQTARKAKGVAGILTIGCGSLGDSIWKLGKCIAKTDLVP